ncbi:lysine-specific demethylase 3B, partial [Trifolium medium]|nr:lysine-specific demethylase 3B [Trifolium medium]
NGDEVARAMDGGAQAMDVATEIILLSDDDGSVKGDDVVIIEDSDSDREKQDMDIGAETASLKDDEGSIEGDDMA